MSTTTHNADSSTAPQSSLPDWLETVLNTEFCDMPTVRTNRQGEAYIEDINNRVRYFLGVVDREDLPSVNSRQYLVKTGAIEFTDDERHNKALSELHNRELSYDEL